MGKNLLRGFVTFKEMASYYNCTPKTFRKKVKNLLPYLKNGEKRKKLYAPHEWKFILKNLGRNGYSKGT